MYLFVDAKNCRVDDLRSSGSDCVMQWQFVSDFAFATEWYFVESWREEKQSADHLADLYSEPVSFLKILEWILTRRNA